MGITSVFLLGIIGVIFSLIFKSKILSMIKREGTLVRFLQNRSWFKNPYSSGIVLFLWNTLITSVVALLFLILVLSGIDIAFLNIAVLGGGTIVSIVAWSTFNIAWSGSRKSRIKMASIGSSFYVLLGVYALYQFLTLKPSYQGEDVFMAALGLIAVLIIAIVALLTCFVFTGFQKRQHLH
ncbi:hypothetical protein [Priestia endophytica]|uniref:Uncharacterized protein n=1 Tax=Priestia endophytica TaxID=135735 RepID=A0AAX1Q987_9BACI|nr:hypothetical protein [Priestia endophytica]RAS76668.1 hypothetical protein A3864_12660 [Priestia endophytica]